MKLVFLETGDYIDIIPEKNKFVEKWFEHIFDHDINEYEIFFSSTSNVETWIAQLNESMVKANDYAKTKIRNFEFYFKPLKELDQDILNYNHKQWVVATEKYLNELYPQPDFWHEVNHLIHRIERNYSTLFWNKCTQDPLDSEYCKYLKPEFCSYDVQDLMIHYTNLGRHQYNQWLTGSSVDEETNNYKTVSMNFEYQYNLDVSPVSSDSVAPASYIAWCQTNKLEILPPWIPIAKFAKYDRHEIKKIMHKNLTRNKSIRFEYD